MGYGVVRGGRQFYGQPIGVLMMDVIVPRLPGDIGNAFTFDFPVRYKVVRGATLGRVVEKGTDPRLLEPFIEGAKELEAEGVRAITASCGYLAYFQEGLADAVNVPVFTSSLIQVPMVSRMLRKDQKIGILTADSRTLSKEHLRAAGIGDVPVVIQGSENTPAFYSVYPTNGIEVDWKACRQGVLDLVEDLLTKNPEVGAIVCEGSNFAMFRADIQKAFGIPFFDIVTLTRMVYQTVYPVPTTRGWACM